jgi:hypothetical protein
MFGRLRRNKQLPLSGAPAAPREKIYSAGSGYVYSYFYLGHRPRREGVEHVFDVSADRRTFKAVSVLLSDAALARWQTAHERALTVTERYAIAKLALQQALDEWPDPARQGPIRVEPADVAPILASLGIDY